MKKRTKQSNRSSRRVVRDLPARTVAQVKGGIDKASPILMNACATGRHIKEATVTV